MDKTNKVRILKAIRSGSIPLQAIQIEAGTYHKTNRPAIYRNDSGYEIEYLELIELCKKISLTAESIFVQDGDFPEVILISESYIEGQQNTEIQVVDKNAVENLLKL